jgi:hypothetical protein
MLRHVALVRTDVSRELSASFIRVTRIGELGAVPPKHRFLQELHGVMSHKMPFTMYTVFWDMNGTPGGDFLQKRPIMDTEIYCKFPDWCLMPDIR